MTETTEANYFQPHWYAVYTRSRHEKTVAQQLGHKSVDHFLPLFETIRNWRNGRFRIRLPLFPGYLFVHIALQERLQVLQVPGVVGLVSSNGMPVALPQAEIETIRDALTKGMQAHPHPYLTVGSRVRINSGPLEGLNGILVRKKGQLRVVVSVDLIMRSIAVDIDASEVEPMK
ncbi:MAG: UpxY family transcription antiterminator [Candidatus Sulfotelmatobacter sp.]